MTDREIIDETEIFTEALGASVAQGNLTVDQLKRQLEGGLAYVEAQGADNVAEELLVALTALDKVIRRATGPIYNLGADRFPEADAPSVTARATLPRAPPKEAESTNAGFKTRRARSGSRDTVSSW
jgi:hypothetical protein